MDRQDDSFLSVSMLGDIREDIEFLGLTMKDIFWIILITLICGSLPFLLPIVFWFKIVWIVTVFVLMLFARYQKWGYRFKRLRLFMRQERVSDGSELPKILGLKEDGWFYRSYKDIHVVVDVKSPPWNTAVLSKKRQRLGGYENFLRACVREGFEVCLSAEQIPDFRHEIWNNMKSSTSLSPGIEKLKAMRIQMFEDLARNSQARRSVYTLKLTINELSIAMRERDDEPEGLTKDQLKRFRMVAELREKLNRVLQYLEIGGHDCSILSGYSVPEILGRWWDRALWEEWKSKEGTWGNLVDESVDTANSEEAAEDKPVKRKKFSVRAIKNRLGGTLGVIKNIFRRKKKQEVINVHEFIEEPAAAVDPDERDIPDEVAAAADPDERNIPDEVAAAADPDERNIPDEVTTAADPDEWNIPDEVAAAADPNEWNIPDEVAAVADPDEWNIATEESSDAVDPKESVISQILKKSKKARESIIAAFSLFTRSKSKRMPVTVKIDAAAEKIPSAKEEQPLNNYVPQLEGVRILTSPVPSGKTFIAANLAAANGSDKHPVSLIDLSPDRGVLTVLNPKSIKSKYELWEAWESRNAPGVEIWTPKLLASIKDIVCLINEQAGKGPVLVDVPWRFPNINELLSMYNHAAIVDSDYHHWLQWDKSVDQWDGEIWLNQTDDELKKLLSQLIKEKFNKPIDITFPNFPEANKWLLQGRPLASNPQASRFFLWKRNDREEEEVC